MLTTTMFALVRSSIKATGDMQRIQRESDETNRLLEIFRSTFQTLPSSATIELALPGTGAGVNQELTITGAPAIFAFGERPTSYQPTLIGLQPDPKGSTSEEGLPLFDLSVSRQDIIPATDGRGIMVQQTMVDKVTDDQGRYWMPLLSGVQSLKWRFLKESTDEWLEVWSEAQWPDLIEVNLQLRDRHVPIRLVYPRPQLQLRAPTNTSSSNTRTSARNPAPTPSTGGGGTTR
jgi:hypothetical protein